LKFELYSLNTKTNERVAGRPGRGLSVLIRITIAHVRRETLRSFRLDRDLRDQVSEIESGPGVVGLAVPGSIPIPVPVSVSVSIPVSVVVGVSAGGEAAALEAVAKAEGGLLLGVHRQVGRLVLEGTRGPGLAGAGVGVGVGVDRGGALEKGGRP